MNDNDLLFVGFDLQKDPHVILRAYDDAQGVTAAFNLTCFAGSTASSAQISTSTISRTMPFTARSNARRAAS